MKCGINFVDAFAQIGKRASQDGTGPGAGLERNADERCHARRVSGRPRRWLAHPTNEDDLSFPGWRRKFGRRQELRC